MNEDIGPANHELKILEKAFAALAKVDRVSQLMKHLGPVLFEYYDSSLAQLYATDSFGNRLLMQCAFVSPDLGRSGASRSLKFPTALLESLIEQDCIVDLNTLGASEIEEMEHLLPSGHRLVCVPFPKGPDKMAGCLVIGRRSPSRSVSTQGERRLLHILSSMAGRLTHAQRQLDLEKEELVVENYHLREELKTRYHFENIIGFSGVMQEVFETTAMVAKSKASVLIQGESGTGKELIAHAIHYNSSRANHPFIRVNCGALSEGLLESELFGHLKGAFTGAIRDRKGIFEAAHGGTVFLDEVADMSPRLQVKILRVLQEREFERVGDTASMSVDVRIIAASNKPLEDETRGGGFREDLYYRLSVVPVYLPPLRERREDIGHLLEHFLDKFNRENFKNVNRIPKVVLDAFRTYDWPGNVRELENCVERMVVLSKGPVLEYDLLPLAIRTAVESAGGMMPTTLPKEDLQSFMLSYFRSELDSESGVYGKVVGCIEKVLIEEMLRRSDNVRRRAAEMLGMNRNTLHEKIHQLGIRVGARKNSRKYPPSG